jgi:hypothetical protein
MVAKYRSSQILGFRCAYVRMFVWLATFFRRLPGWGLLRPCLCGVMRHEEVA